MIEAKGGIMSDQVNHKRQKGAVSLFVVIFTALLFVAVTVGFTVLMLSDQQQATDNDLAQSALDSANAGTEDAKRVLAQYADCQERNNAVVGVDCNNMRQAIEANQCGTINRALGSDSQEERKIQQSEDDGSSALDQAYTCVKITPDTDSYIGKTRNEGDIRLVPLKTGGAPFDTVQISWLKRDDMNLPASEKPVFAGTTAFDSAFPDFPDITDVVEKAQHQRLPSKTAWEQARAGAMLRVGSIQYTPGSVDLNKIDTDARAAFLYPSRSGSGGTIDLAVDLLNKDIHRPLPPAANQDGIGSQAVNYPVEVKCDDAATEAFCTTFIKLPPGETANTFRYLTLASVYRNVSFEIKLLNGSNPNPVKFRNVQPEIDVTGRANNVFRRLVSRVESADANEAPYPRAAVGAGSSVCKDFVVTDDPGDYRSDAPASPECPDLRI